MFAQIKGVVDVVSFALKEGVSFKDKAGRKKAVLQMLETYFLLKDAAEDGLSLIQEAGSDPVATVKGKSLVEAEALVARWDWTLRKQASRLMRVQKHLLGQDHLSIIDPKLEQMLNSAIGSKFDSVVTLEGIGASLYFYCIFPLAEKPEEKADYVLAMAGESGDMIAMDRVEREVSDLIDSLERFRTLVVGLVSSEELVKWSKEARENTQPPK